jgi:hypothetical protein
MTRTNPARVQGADPSVRRRRPADEVAATPIDQLLSLGFSELAGRAHIHGFLIGSFSTGHVPFGLSTLDFDSRLAWHCYASYWLQQARHVKLDPLPELRRVTSFAESRSNWSEFQRWARDAEAKSRGVLPVAPKTRGPGRKVDPKLNEIADFVRGMRAQDMQWKEMTGPIAEQFGKRYKAASLPKLLARKRVKKAGTK